MKRFAIVLSLVVGAALFLSACEVTVTPTPGPTPPTPNETAIVGTNPDSSVRSKNLAGGASWIYNITVPSDVRADSEVVYLELNENLNIRVRAATGILLYSSSSDQYFGRGAAGIASAAATTGSSALDAQAITAPTTCRGSCIIFEPGDQGTYFLEVTNNRSSSVSYDLFAFGDNFDDPYEPRNNNRVDPPVLAVGPSFAESGALETVGDVDFWLMDGTGQVAFDMAESPLDIRADLISAGGSRIETYQRGEIIPVTSGQFLRIYSRADLAAVSSNSTYNLSNP